RADTARLRDGAGGGRGAVAPVDGGPACAGGEVRQRRGWIGVGEGGHSLAPRIGTFERADREAAGGAQAGVGDGDGHRGRGTVAVGVAGRVGEAVAAHEVVVGRVGERAVAVEGYAAIARAAGQGRRQAVAVGIRVV